MSPGASKTISINPKVIDPSYSGSQKVVEVSAESLLAKKELIESRHRICNQCDQLKDGRCGACGCPIPGKLRFLTSSCPLNKWLAEKVEVLLPDGTLIKSAPPPPTIANMAKSFFGSAMKFAASGFPVTPLEKVEERLALCRGCEHWDPKGFGGTGRCKVCGCSTQAKLRMATSECPLRKWSAV